MKYMRYTSLEDAVNQNMNPGDPDECWIWQGCLNTDGYGVLRLRNIVRYAHRAAYEVFVGPIPEGMLVCHTCDIKACVNPSHLWVGTAKDNTQDMMNKGRGMKGIRMSEEAKRKISNSRQKEVGISEGGKRALSEFYERMRIEKQRDSRQLFRKGLENVGRPENEVDRIQ